MTRMSKQGKRRALSPKKRKPPSVKSGPKKDNLKNGFKPHDNAYEGEGLFIPKIR